MITISGKSVFGGVSIGKILFYQRNDKVIKREQCSRFYGIGKQLLILV